MESKAGKNTMGWFRVSVVDGFVFTLDMNMELLALV